MLEINGSQVDSNPKNTKQGTVTIPHLLCITEDVLHNKLILMNQLILKAIDGFQEASGSRFRALCHFLHFIR